MIEKLELLLHLARERHFGKAATAAGISQPSLSSAVKSLEEQLGVVIVERGSRFRGFTPEGELLLGWARKLTSDVAAMKQEVRASRHDLAGELHIGVIPTALPAISQMTVPFLHAFPDVRFRISSLTSNQILQKLSDLEIDAGISYIDGEPLGRFRGVPLYEEHYALLVSPDAGFEGRETVTWREAGQLQLCQLSGDMQNRRLIDRHFREAGATPHCSVESNSMSVLYAHVRTGAWASVMPVQIAEELEQPGRLRAVPLSDPDVRHVVGLVLPDRDTQTPLVTRFTTIARSSSGDFREDFARDRIDQPSAAIDRICLSRHGTTLLIGGCDLRTLPRVPRRPHRMTIRASHDEITTRTRQILAAFDGVEAPLIEILHAIQHDFGYVPEAVKPQLAEHLNLSRAEVHGVVSFYHDFRAEPAGRHTVKVCRAEACQSMGGEALAESLSRHLGVAFGDTSADGSVTLEPVYCLGLCACAPAALVDGRPVGRLDEAQVAAIAMEVGR